MYQSLPIATDGKLAILNHSSVLNRCREVSISSHNRLGIKEQLIDEEAKRIQYFGDYTSLDRMKAMSLKILKSNFISAEDYLVLAKISSARHHFEEAKEYCKKAISHGAEIDSVENYSRSIDQATGFNLLKLLAYRIEQAKVGVSTQNLILLGALYAEIGEIEKANEAYKKAISSYWDTSPFPLALICFQLGMLNGEIAPDPNHEEAEFWYQKSIDYLPGYVHATVHLSEILIDKKLYEEAILLLTPLLHSEDPEVSWRYSQAQEGLHNLISAKHYLDRAEKLFNYLLNKHELAFADHAVEFYLSTERNLSRALDLALKNLSQRPTLRAYQLALNASQKNNEIGIVCSLKDEAREKFHIFKSYFDSELCA